MKDYKKIENYGIIGDLDTCALVGKDGSIDWCCFPHIESPSVFAGVLDIDKGGHFAVHPSDNFDSEQRYIERTNVLQAVFKTSTGTAILADFMPVIAEENTEKQLRKGIYRKIVCDKGFMDLKIVFKPRSDYAQTQTIIKPTERGVITIGNNEQALLDSPFKLQIRDAEAVGVHPVKEGDIVWLVMQYGDHVPVDPEASEGVKRYK
jgi:GH15 family glucan-1,4-alpha-glucosidase